jgi:hypothetical protein
LPAVDRNDENPAAVFLSYVFLFAAGSLGHGCA